MTLTLKQAEFQYDSEFALPWLFASIEDCIDMEYRNFDEWCRDNNIKIVEDKIYD